MTRKRCSVELTQGAEADPAALHGYMARHRSPEQADALLDDLLARIETFENVPERGSVPNELQALGIVAFRQTLLPPYRLIYRVLGRRVVIPIIADRRRETGALLDRRLLGS